MNLVIRGPDIETAALKELAKLSGADAIEQIEPNVFYLRNASPADGIAELCAQQKLDFAFVSEAPDSHTGGGS
jgi:phosphoserine phosphatase